MRNFKEKWPNSDIKARLCKRKKEKNMHAHILPKCKIEYTNNNKKTPMLNSVLPVLPVCLAYSENGVERRSLAPPLK